uniref:Keratin n=1 Tax=Pelusios castaneus TaxID=367368 RepID=A0A8C8SCU7_9SAUR
NEPCFTSCSDSRVVVYPPPVVVTFPVPILSSCSLETIVGSSAPFDIRSLFSCRGFLNYGGSYSSGRLCNDGRAYASGLSENPCNKEQPRNEKQDTGP